MWMLVRSSALGRDELRGQQRVLAACPDTGERGDPWRWTVAVRYEPHGPMATVETDGDFLASSELVLNGGESRSLTRASGEVLVATVLAGQARIASVTGPWERWIQPDDVFVLEGEEDEDIRISLDGAGARASVFRLSPNNAARALRWVP